MFRNFLINLIIGLDSGSRSSSVRETSELDKYLSALLVEKPSNEYDFDILDSWKQFGVPIFPIVGYVIYVI